MIKMISIFFLFEGFFWLLVTGYVFVAISGISDPMSLRSLIFGYGYHVFGAGLLMGGSIMTLGRKYFSLGPKIVSLGVGLLMIYLALDVIRNIRPNSNDAIARPNYYLDLVYIGLAFISGIAAYLLYKGSKSR